MCCYRKRGEYIMSKIRVLLLASAFTVLTVVATAPADSRVPAKLLPTASETPAAEVSLKSSDCCTTAPAAECKTYKPCVTYCGGFCTCGPKASQVLMVKDPCDCCCEIAEIPVCLPACCTKPCVNSRCGLFGRGIVTYEYDCGACVTIVFRRCGDVVVKYSG
jgi:hypothetical protein